MPYKITRCVLRADFSCGGVCVPTIVSDLYNDQAPALDDSTLRQHGEFLGRQPQFAAEDVLVVLADERRSSGDPPRRAVVEGGLAGVDEATAQFRVLHLLPETAVVQMGIV